ncbi:hypothetical protein EDD86DRAFT_245768 [Gorgonomyces haynaldii]|nr:hypothetical protein EDD86DRAFT_245768 [Gorgonomyces haynaldii]
MSKVVKELFGAAPEFLNIKSQKTLFQLILPLPQYGVGRRVLPTRWFHEQKDKYYIITRLGRVYGKRVTNGQEDKEVLLPAYAFSSWNFHESELN